MKTYCSVHQQQQ